METILEREIRAALDAAPADAQWNGPGRWTLSLQTCAGEPLTATCHLAAGWLILDAPWPDANSGAAGAAPAGAPLPGLAKCCLGCGRQPRLRLEMPVADGDDGDYAGGVGERVHLAVTDFVRAAQQICGDKTAALDAPAADAPDVDLAALCSEAGWPGTGRASGRVMVELGLPSVYLQAAVERTGSGVRASVELAAQDGLDDLCAEAAARFLLLAAGRVRMAAPAIERTSAGAAARIGVQLPACPSAALLSHALAALSAGARITVRETRILMTDTDVAREYLTRT